MVALTGGVVIALGIFIAVVGAGERRVLPRAAAMTFAGLLMASMLLAAHAGLVSVAVMAFFPQVMGLGFYGLHTPFVLAALASLVMPALVKSYQQLAGERAFELAALVAVGLWGAVEALNHLLTPAIAAAHGFIVKTSMIPDVRLKFLTLGFMLLPAALINRIGGTRSWIAGGLAGVLYAAELDFWLMTARVATITSVPLLLVAPGAAALSATVGTRWGRWIRGRFSTVAPPVWQEFSWPFGGGRGLATGPFSRRSR